MKLLLCLAVVAIIAGAQALTDEQKAKWSKWSSECRDQSGVSQEQINKIRKNEFVEYNDKLGQHALCFAKKAGLAQENGDVNVEALKERLKKVAANDEVDNIIAKCVLKKDTPEESNYETYKCLRDNKPTFSPV